MVVQGLHLKWRHLPACGYLLAGSIPLTCHEGMGPGPHVPLVVIEFFRQGTQDEELSYHLDDEVC